MTTASQPPSNSDGDTAGQVLAYNARIFRWQIVGWNLVVQRPKDFPEWQALPAPPL